MVGLLVRFFQGFFTYESVMKLRFRMDLQMWYDNYILQTIEENVFQELSYDKKGNKREQDPNPQRVREIVLERIKARKKEYVKKVLD